jgi:hypothetical protein
MYCIKSKHSQANQLPIRVVCATAGHIHAFGQTMLGKSLQAHHVYMDLEIHVYADNKQGLGEIYNQAIDAAEQDPAILVFVHDDVMILDWFWERTLRLGLTEFDVVGLAGSTHRRPDQVSWCMLDDTLTQSIPPEFMSGIVAHGTQMPPHNVGMFGEPGQPCKLLDGLFLACDSRMLWRTGLRFDDQFEFHFYDMDFCRQAELLNVSMGTVAISVMHGSQGEYNPGWHHMKSLYKQKWSSS